MSSSRVRVKVVVKSREVPFAIANVEIPTFGPFGLKSRIASRSVVYKRVLEERDKVVLEEMREAASSNGFAFEVVDLGREGKFVRAVRRLLELPSLSTKGGLTRSLNRPNEATPAFVG